MVLPKKSGLLVLSDTGIILIAYFLTGAFWIGTLDKHHVPAPETAVLYLFSFLFIFYIIDFYDRETNFGGPANLLKHLAGIVAATGVLAALLYLIPNPDTGTGAFLTTALIIGAGTYFSRRFLLGMVPQKILIIGAGKAGTMLYKIMRDNTDYKVTGVMTDDDFPVAELTPIPVIRGGLTMLKQVIKDQKIDILVLAISNLNPALIKSALDYKLRGLAVYDMRTFYEMVTGKMPVEHITDSWLLFTPFSGIRKNIYNRKLKRQVDIFLSLFGLVFTLPLTLTIAAAIKCDSSGPALFKQKRVGLNGKIFTLIKFRSMVNGTEKDRRFAGDLSDPRITRVGRILRRTRLDEIPQMWNVLKGDMSFIGPRALIESEVNEFESRIPYFSLRHSVRPGITGWAQVKYKHGAKVEDGLEKLQYDLFYIKNLSPLLDFQILMNTVKVVLSGKGAR